MTNYRRFSHHCKTWFFTINLAQRKNNHLLVNHIELLGKAFREVKKVRPFTIEAIVVMPDHLHCIWTLPEHDLDFSTRWRMIKGKFSAGISKGERISKSRLSRRERGIWQRRFWAHALTSQEDFNAHCDYIHWNPVKHKYVNKVADWQYSSFHQFVKLGIYPINWGHSGNFAIQESAYLE